MINAINSTNQQAQQTGSKFDRAGEGAMFPNLSVFSNEKVSEYLQSVASNETSAYNLYNDDTNELNLNKQVWQEAVLQQEVENLGNSNPTEVIKCYNGSSIDGDFTRYEYDSNEDGNRETHVTFYTDGGASVAIYNESDTEMNTIYYGSTGKGVGIRFDNGDDFSETFGAKEGWNRPGNRHSTYPNCPEYNSFTFIHPSDAYAYGEHTVYNIEYDDEGKIAGIENGELEY